MYSYVGIDLSSVLQLFQPPGQPGQPFFQIRARAGEGQAQGRWRSKRVAGNQGDMVPVEQIVSERRGIRDRPIRSGLSMTPDALTRTYIAPRAE